MANKKEQVASRVTNDELESFYNLAKQNMNFAKLLMEDQLTGFKDYFEELLYECARLYANSKMFKDYIFDMMEEGRKDENGLIPLYVFEVANITKCMLAMLESKEILVGYGISLEKQ